jgi:hypothetical protein
MTRDTKFHFKTDTLDAVHGSDCAVALLAGNFPVYMTLVIEQYMFREIVYFIPGRRGFRIVIPVFFLNPGVFWNDILMAMKTFFNRRNSRVIGIRGIGVTIYTLNLFNPSV